VGCDCVSCRPGSLQAGYRGMPVGFVRPQFQDEYPAWCQHPGCSAAGVVENPATGGSSCRYHAFEDGCEHSEACIERCGACQLCGRS